ncbi:MAG: carboxypeptidase-like regulatory domain-containing protein [Janthinobacterium lividum]
MPLSAQVGRNGSITGEAIAPDRAPVAGATLTLSGSDGLTRTSLTAPNGRFSFPDLPSGSYTIRTTAQSFAPLGPTAVPVAIGRTTSITLPFVLAFTGESVSVIAIPQALDTAQTSSVVNINRDRVEELPIPSRNYLSFVALSPQAAPANPAYSASTLDQSSGGFGFGGLRPSSNAVRIDGVGDDDEYAGTSRTQLSPEAISDFQIVNHGFAAQSGGAAGGAIDVQTRAGLNRVHGDAFVLSRMVR